MSDHVEVPATITVVDKATGPIDRIIRAFQNLAVMARTASASINTQLNRGLFGGITKNVSNLGQSLGRLGGQIRNVSAPLAGLLGLTGGLSIAALAKGTNEWVESTKKLGVTAKLFRTTAENLDLLHFIADKSLVSMEDFDAAIGKMDLNLAKAAGNPATDKLASLMKYLNIPMKDANGLRNGIDLLDEFRQAILKQKSVGVQRDMLQAIFGKGGKQMLPMMTKTNAEVDALAARARELSLRNDADVANANRWSAATKGVGDEMGDLAEEIYRRLVPAFTPVIEKFREFIAQTKDPFIAEFEKQLRALDEYLKTFSMEETIKGFREWYWWSKGILEQLGGWKPVLIGIGLVLAGPLFLAFTSLAGAILSVSLALGKLSLAILTNPFALAASAIVLAIGGLAYVIWSEWDKIEANFIDLWKRIKEVFWNALGMLDEFVKLFVPGGLLKVWELLGTGFTNIWTGVIKTFEWAWGIIKGIVDNIVGAVDRIDQALEKLRKTPMPPAAPPPNIPGLNRVPGLPKLASAIMPQLASLILPTPAMDGGVGYGGAAPIRGAVQVDINFDNLPAGTKTSVDSNGAVRVTGNVGRSMVALA